MDGASSPDAGLAISVTMKPMTSLQIFMDRRHRRLVPQTNGGVCLFDLSTSPIALLQDPFHKIRIQISQQTLDDLAYHRGRRAVGGLTPSFERNDTVE